MARQKLLTTTSPDSFTLTIMAHATPGTKKLPSPIVGDGWDGGAAPAPALSTGPFTTGILPSALRAHLRRFEIRSRRICPASGRGENAGVMNGDHAFR